MVDSQSRLTGSPRPYASNSASNYDNGPKNMIQTKYLNISAPTGETKSNFSTLVEIPSTNRHLYFYLKS